MSIDSPAPKRTILLEYIYRVPQIPVADFIQNPAGDELMNLLFRAPGNDADVDPSFYQLNKAPNYRVFDTPFMISLENAI